MIGRIVLEADKTFLRPLKNIIRFALITCYLALNSHSTSNPSLRFTENLEDNWKVVSSENISVSGSVLSTHSYNDAGWYPADVPSTVLAVLVKNNVYQEPYFARNLENIDTGPFEKPWWYRKTFRVNGTEGFNVFRLVLGGINYRANVWLNGRRIGSADTIQGCFRRFTFTISRFIRDQNVLAIEVIPPKRDELTIGFVDWNPRPPDGNLGIWRGVQLIKSKFAALDNPFVKSRINLETLKEADLEISVHVNNFSDRRLTSRLKVEIEDIRLSRSVELNPFEIKEIRLTSAEFPQLHVDHPRLWWPNGMGEPNLYALKLTLESNGVLWDQKFIRFGIREAADYINEEGHKGFKINGKKVLIKGGGWVDDLMLADSDDKVKAQLDYVKHMNLNAVRMEGFWGRNEKLYDCADENGILVMIGWSCHWEWREYCGRTEDAYIAIRTPEDMDLHFRSYMDQIVWLRNHPSVFLWIFGSDKMPRPELEQKLLEGARRFDGTRPTLNSCKDVDFDGVFQNNSKISGLPGVKMRGPYGYVTPNYWTADRKLGGAYGFNTETGPGPQVPPFESIKKMLPETDLWPINDMWSYHCARNEFRNLNRFLTAFNSRYGEAADAEEFAQMAQVSNYEAIRAMFESFEINKFKATGVIQWMLNAAWPKMYWQLYDWYLMPNGAFYGTQTACRPLNIAYDYANKKVVVTNDFLEEKKALNADVRVYDIHSILKYDTILQINMRENCSLNLLTLPRILNLSTTFFISLKLKDGSGKEIANNFYWLSTQEDVCDFERSQWFFTPNQSYADLTQLKRMEKVFIRVEPEIQYKKGDCVVRVKYDNPNPEIAFFIESLIVDEKTGASILPVFWDDNYITLLPGETQIHTAVVRKKDIAGKKPVFRYSGVNVAR